MTILFHDRYEAGRYLAAGLKHFANRPDVVVLALPRGGVPVGYEVAKALNVPLDVFVVRKLGVPGQEELAMGAIASGGVRVLNQEVIVALGIPETVIDEVAAKEERELERQERIYRDGGLPLDVQGRTVILVDDGLAAEVDEVICAATPEPFWAVGAWYGDFSQTSDEEVRDLLRRAASFPAPKAA